MTYEIVSLLTKIALTLSFLTSIWRKYKIIFAETRKKQPDPFLGEYFQWLA
jgi:hypothetical protein